MNIPRPYGFKVEEIPGTYSQGEHTHFTLWKREWNTIDAIKVIAKKLGVSQERFGYAGLKDRNAVTTQRVSAWRVPKKRLEQLKIKDIKISDIKEGLERIWLGSHQGNKFTIILEGVKELRKPVKVPNFFGKQRFGGSESLGKCLIKKDWEGVIKLLGKNPNGSYEKKVLKYYERTSDSLKAIKLIDKKIRALWVNAWQAKKWNDNLDIRKKNQELISYGKIDEMPELGEFKGGERKTIMDIKDYKATQLKNHWKLEFTLGKGSYATVLIEYILKKQ